MEDSEEGRVGGKVARVIRTSAVAPDRLVVPEEEKPKFHHWCSNRTPFPNAIRYSATVANSIRYRVFHITL